MGKRKHTVTEDDMLADASDSAVTAEVEGKNMKKKKSKKEKHTPEAEEAMDVTVGDDCAEVNVKKEKKKKKKSKKERNDGDASEDEGIVADSGDDAAAADPPAEEQTAKKRKRKNKHVEEEEEGEEAAKQDGSMEEDEPAKKKKKKKSKDTEEAGAEASSDDAGQKEKKHKKKKKKSKDVAEELSASSDGDSDKKSKSKKAQRGDDGDEAAAEDKKPTVSQATAAAGTAWTAAEFDNDQRKDKFLKLMGGKKAAAPGKPVLSLGTKKAFRPSLADRLSVAKTTTAALTLTPSAEMMTSGKKGSKSVVTHLDDAKKAVSKSATDKMNAALEHQFELALNTRQQIKQGFGLGFSNKKFEIDTSTVRSKQFS